jgi:WD40 repeat protein
MNITRRQLFTGAIATTILGGAASYFISDDKGFLLGWDKNIYFFKSNSKVSSLTGLGVWNLETKSRPHDFLKLKGDLYCAMPKWEDSIAFFDVAKKKLIKEVTLGRNEQFMGHGIYDPKTNLLYLSTIRFLEYGFHAQGTGFIKVYDCNTLKEVREFSTHGIEPHECLINGEDMIVLNTGINQKRQGSTSTIAILELQTGKLKKLIDAPKNFYFAHFEKIAEGKYFLCHEFPENINDNRISPYVLDLKDGLYQLEDLGKVYDKGGLLTPAFIKKHGMVAATAPYDGLVIFWDVKTKKHIKTIKMNDPRAIFYKEDEDLLIVATKKGIYKVDPKNFNINDVFTIKLGESISSHGYWV